MKLPDAAAFQRLKFAPAQPITVKGDEMLIVLSLIQLALRHAAVPKESQRVGIEFAAQLESRIRHVAPEFGDLCEMGWDRQFDLPKKGLIG